MVSNAASSNQTYISDLTTFLASSEAAPISDHQWIHMSQTMSQLVRETLASEDLFQIFIYNKSRSIDRICPYCRKHYQATDSIDNIESDTTGSYSSLHYEQALSGICSWECFRGINGSSAMDDQFGRSGNVFFVVP